MKTPRPPRIPRPARHGRPTRRLGWKLLAWMLGTFFTTLAVQIAVAVWQQPTLTGAILESSSDVKPDFPGRSARVLAPLLDADNAAATRNFLDSLRRELGIECMIWNSRGTWTMGGRPTPRAEQLAREATTAPRELQTREDGANWLYTAQKIRTPEGRTWTLVTRQSPDANISQGQSLAVVLVVTALFCAAMARYLVSPAEKLRRATRQFADGDLSVRVGPSMGRRRDELADLGRDFDAMAERIETLLRNERRLLVDVSHELRSPLARQSAALELAREKVAGAPEVVPYLARIERENERLGELIGQLLALTRLESGQFALHLEPLDLSELAREIAEDLRFEGQARGVPIETNFAPDAFVCGDRELLRRALENVGRNALRHTDAARGIVLTLEKRGQNWCLTVRDFGPGVPPDLLAEIWKPFRRVDKARDRDSGGAGLGLAITKHAVLLHDGQVEARLCEDGGGLIIEMCLPALSAPS